MGDEISSRAEHEIALGKKLIVSDPEEIWGWSTPAGMRRAARRGKMIRRGAALEAGTTVLEIGYGSGPTSGLIQWMDQHHV